MTLPVVFTANGPSGYNLTKSLRFRSSASAYLNRTPASAGNRKTWTLSTWVKRGKLSADTTILSAGYSTNPWFVLQYVGSDNTLAVSATAGTSASWKTSAVFRDPSAWYHVVCVVDTTSSTTTITNTSTDRIRLYVNNVQQTLSGGTVPTQNSDLQVNNTVSHTIGGYSSEYFDGYMTEINFIDGQALTPSSFGSTNPATGVWQPAKYTGTYGTNGFYLPFTNTTSTTTIGYDFSGNSNNWTSNNISLTAGTTYDSMNDVPTLTSATTANYAVFNPVNVSGGGSTITNGNLACSAGSTSTYGKILSSIGMTTGKWYCEVTVTDIGSLGAIGLGDGTAPSGSTGLGGAAGELAYLSNGNKYTNASATAYGATYTTNDIIGIAYDASAGSVTFYKNNTSQGAITGLSGLKYFAVGSSGGTNPQYAVNFGQRPFAYTPPTGFVALNTYNLPTSTIVKGNTVMDAQLYNGNGTTQTITTASGFKPDLVWIKGRNYADNHTLWNTVVGAQKSLSSNTTTAETTRLLALTAFTSTGFTLGTDTIVNYALGTYVGWEWNAGSGSSSSNTNGSITSTVSVNPTAGFSVVTYTGNATSGATVGHGLGVAPSLIITKNRDASTAWWVYHASLGNTKYIVLNTTAAEVTSSSAWNNTSPTSSVFSLGAASPSNANQDVAYCWAEIAGFSKFGSYTGNGSTDGPFVHLGFRPKFLLIKASSTSDNWSINDSSRDVYNAWNARLYPDLSNAENAGGAGDFLSNGFKLRSSSQNSSGVTYIYMAFAETPFRYSNAR